jgi:phosphonate transport system ATP-binding protein
VAFGPTIALDGVDLVIEPGEQVALLGPSGAGKSTLLGVIAGRVAPTAGSVRVLGEDWASLSADAVRRMRRRVAVMHQHLDLVEQLRVVHNVNAGRLGQWSAWRAVRSLMRPLERDEVVRALAPLGLADRVDERTSRLSGGQRQRVAVARVLRQRGELVLADEPISAVDPAWRERVLGVLVADATHRSATLVLSSHDASLAVASLPRSIGIVGGRVVFDVPSSQVTADLLDGLYGLGVA